MIIELMRKAGYRVFEKNETWRQLLEIANIVEGTINDPIKRVQFAGMAAEDLANCMPTESHDLKFWLREAIEAGPCLSGQTGLWDGALSEVKEEF